MLEVNSNLGVLISCIIRQIYLSSYRFSIKEEDFYDYFKDKIDIYNIALLELKKIIDNKNHISFLNNLKIFLMIKEYYNYVEVLLFYKLINEFIQMLKKRNFDDTFMTEVGLPSEIVYSDFISKRLSRKQKNKINNVEHFGQNLKLDYYSIEKILKT